VISFKDYHAALGEQGNRMDTVAGVPALARGGPMEAFYPKRETRKNRKNRAAYRARKEAQEKRERREANRRQNAYEQKRAELLRKQKNSRPAGTRQFVSVVQNEAVPPGMAFGATMAVPLKGGY
jgi:ribosomal protein L9